MAEGSSGFRWPQFVLAASVPLAVVLAALVLLDYGQAARRARRAEGVDLSPIALTTRVGDVVQLPDGGGNAAFQYEFALELLEDERPKYETLKRQLDQLGVTAETRVDFECLVPLVAGTQSRRCWFEERLPHTWVEMAAERPRLDGLLSLGRLLAARSGTAELAGHRTEAVDLASRLVILGWHVMGQPDGQAAATPPTTARAASGPTRPASASAGEPVRVSVDAQLAGLTLIRWGAKPLARLRFESGDLAGADRAAALTDDAARTSDALALRRKTLADQPFLQARAARVCQEPAVRVLAVALLGHHLAGRRPILIGRAQDAALRRALDQLADDPDPDVRAAVFVARTNRWGPRRSPRRSK